MYRRVAAESIQKMELADAMNVRKYRKQEQEAARRVRQMIQAKRWDMRCAHRSRKRWRRSWRKRLKRCATTCRRS